jgi:hypothetical protein
MDGVGLTARVDRNPVLFAFCTVYYSQTALSIMPKFYYLSLFHPFLFPHLRRSLTYL